jgi:membrane associated rhomboid family serine protease
VIPLRDNVRTRSFPWINWLLIFANVFVFLFEISLSASGLNHLILHFGLIPARVRWANPATWEPILTAMFLHGGWLHLIGNMLALFIFGDNIEDRLGHRRYLVFYFLCGFAAAALSIFVTPNSTVPMIGASGAIAGVLGAYFVLYPGGKVTTLIPVFFFPWIVELPSVIFLGFWFLLQFASGVTSLQAAGQVGGVAWWAHVGGFLAGMALLLFLGGAPQGQGQSPVSIEVVYHPPRDQDR